MGTAPQPRRQPSPPGQADAIIRLRKWEIVADAVHIGIPWTSLIIIVGLVAFMVNKLAGKATMAQIGLSFIGNFTISDAVAYVFGGVCFTYGLAERRLRRKKTKGMAAYSAKLEAKIDPERSSSGLTPEGTTRQEDKL